MSEVVGRDACVHRWRGLDGFVNLQKVVDHEVEADRMYVVLQLLAECVGEPAKPMHAHAHRRIGPLDVANADVIFLRLPT